MSYRVLVVGGSYFLGRVLCILASRTEDMELTLVNRGRYSMTHLPRISEFRSDRHDAAGLAALPDTDWDAVVDLCAYSPGDVSFLLQCLRGRVKRYILVSTADVYDRAPGAAADETTPLLSEVKPGPAGEYAFQKRTLERELVIESANHGFAPVILRPAFLYGPYNYAPRERLFIERIVRRQPVLVPTDAAGRFQFVYVTDAANAILECIRQDAAAGEAFNLSAPEVLDYASYIDTLRAVSDIPFSLEAVTVEQVLRDNLPLPFPLTAEESELFDGGKLTQVLGVRYTPFLEGMEKTFKAFKSVYM